jgi:hypothetical protein
MLSARQSRLITPSVVRHAAWRTLVSVDVNHLPVWGIGRCRLRIMNSAGDLQTCRVIQGALRKVLPILAFHSGIGEDSPTQLHLLHTVVYHLIDTVDHALALVIAPRTLGLQHTENLHCVFHGSETDCFPSATEKNYSGLISTTNSKLQLAFVDLGKIYPWTAQNGSSSSAPPS